MFSIDSMKIVHHRLEGDNMLWFRREKAEESPDPLQVALDATVADLRSIGSELQHTYEVFKSKLEKSEGVK